MKYKTIAFDVDGTLYSHDEDNKGIMEHTYDMLRNLKNNGYYLVLCTGRPYNLIPQKLMTYFDYFVLNNGAVVCDKQGKVIKEKGIEKNDVNNIKDFCEIRKRGIILKTWEKAYYYLFEDKVPDYLEEGNHSDIQIGKFEVHETEKIYSMILDLFDSEEKDMRNKYPELIFAHGGFDYYEVYHKEADKINGLNFVLQRLSVSLEECIAFGDSMNDEQMLTTVGLGVAINTGHLELLKKVKNHCNPTTKKGIYNFLIENKIMEDK